MLTRVAKQIGVSFGTIKRFEQFVAGEIDGPIRYEPWSVGYLERWLDGTLTPDIRTKHDIQRILERDSSLSKKQVRALVEEMWAAYDRVLGGGGMIYFGMNAVGYAMRRKRDSAVSTR